MKISKKRKLIYFWATKRKQVSCKKYGMTYKFTRGIAMTFVGLMTETIKSLCPFHLFNSKFIIIKIQCYSGTRNLFFAQRITSTPT